MVESYLLVDTFQQLVSNKKKEWTLLNRVLHKTVCAPIEYLLSPRLDTYTVKKGWRDFKPAVIRKKKSFSFHLATFAKVAYISL